MRLLALRNLRLGAFFSALVSIAFVSHLALTSACSTNTATAVDAGVCQPEAGLCTTNLDCAPTSCDAGADGGMCPTHCTVGGSDSSGYPTFCCALGSPPGTGDGGAPCTGPDDCVTAVCAYEEDYTTTACSAYCNVDADCPAVLPYCIVLDAGAAKLCGLPP
jgi:hypothetical protein